MVEIVKRVVVLSSSEMNTCSNFHDNSLSTNLTENKWDFEMCKYF